MCSYAHNKNQCHKQTRNSKYFLEDSVLTKVGGRTKQDTPPKNEWRTCRGFIFEKKVKIQTTDWRETLNIYNILCKRVSTNNNLKSGSLIEKCRDAMNRKYEWQIYNKILSCTSKSGRGQIKLQSALFAYWISKNVKIHNTYFWKDQGKVDSQDTVGERVKTFLEARWQHVLKVKICTRISLADSFVIRNSNG